MVRMTDIATASPAWRRAARDPDQHQRGLYVVVQPTGNKSFCVRYRYAGRPRKLTLQPGIGLAAARKEAADALYQIARPGHRGRQTARQGGAARRSSRHAGSRVSEFFKREGERMRSAKDWQRDLGRLVFSTLGKRPVADVRRKDIVRLLDNVEDNNGAGQANVTLGSNSRIMNWYAARSDDFRTPIVRGMARTKPSEHARRRILTDDEIRAVWRASDSMAGPFGRYVQFLLLTAARRNEAAHLRWQEVVGADWTLPADRNKTKVDLTRPLSAAAQAVLAKVPRIAGADFVFSADGRRLGGFSRRKAEIDAASGITDWTLHDLRRTARSLMSSHRCFVRTCRAVLGPRDWRCRRHLRSTRLP